ncbi:MAG: BlaI/MecI/CopY family transcriptional regulator [Oscillospiraceae bacterium]|jgi:predicted transcriptional regulator|nr:BlaI/MecI/CopY family transcriptional regulator [Oscillospiraceae bacterium]
MDAIKLPDAELRLMNIIWEREPVSSTELVRLAADALGWKRTTTYTILKRLSQRGAAQNDSSTVTALVPKSSVQQSESRELLEKMYGGSLKMFLVSFLDGGKLSEAEADELKRIIDEKTGGVK